MTFVDANIARRGWEKRGRTVRGKQAMGSYETNPGAIKAEQARGAAARVMMKAGVPSNQVAGWLNQGKLVKSEDIRQMQLRMLDNETLLGRGLFTYLMKERMKGTGKALEPIPAGVDAEAGEDYDVIFELPSGKYGVPRGGLVNAIRRIVGAQKPPLRIGGGGGMPSVPAMGGFGGYTPPEDLQNTMNQW